MARKSKKAKQHADKVKFEAQEQMKQIQAAAEKRAEELRKNIEAAEEAERKAKEEEDKLYKDTVAGIDKLAEDGGFFVGVILNHNDILAVIDLAMKTKEAIKIPYRLYNAEDDTMVLPPKEEKEEPVEEKPAEEEKPEKEEKQPEKIEEEEKQPEKKQPQQTDKSKLISKLKQGGK